MKKILVLSSMIFLPLVVGGRSVDFIDPMIGTDGLGHTTPAATTPFGMVQLGPSMATTPWEWKRCSGYHYDDDCIMGFAHNHISGAGLGALGDILLMPVTEKLQILPGTMENPDAGYISRFSHDEEEASAGYYSVKLQDCDVVAELTATPRVGFHRYTVGHAADMHIVIDPLHGINEWNITGNVEFLSDTEIRGWKQTSGMAGDRKVYFYAKFSRPFDDFGTADGDRIIGRSRALSGGQARAFVTFSFEKGTDVEVAVAISHTCYDGALANYKAEALGKTFDVVHKEAVAMWQAKCDKFDINASDYEKTIFYTAVYHSFISPNLISDVTGDYYLYGKTYHSDIPQYSNYSTWDTYRATHPLFTLMEHEGTAAFVNSLTSRKYEAGAYLPVWECNGNDCICMIGRSPAAIMAEAIVKDIPGIDVEKAYAAMYESIMATDRSDWWYGSEKSGLDVYRDKGYITSEIRTSVAKTMEFNYYDYAMSVVADKLGKKEDAAFFYDRSMGHRYLWNPGQRYIWPRAEDGSWFPMDTGDWDSLNYSYVSGNVWRYSSYTPHDMDYMFDVFGGKAEYVRWLDAIFEDDTEMKGNMIEDISGFIGKYGHGDEPSHQMPYLYVLAGAPEKTQKMVERICRTMYDDTPDGLVNNDDLGQMSSWFIFSALGFYPVNPVSSVYVLGRPMFRKAVLDFGNGNSLEIKAENWSPGKFKVEKALFNGKELSDWTIRHEDIMEGGILTFIMK